MNVLQNLISDLREKRLWPVAAALILALVAVPVLLSSAGNTSAPIAPLPGTGASSASVPALPAVSVTATPSNARLTGRQRDPFTQQVKSKTQSSTAKVSTTSSKSKPSSSSTSSSKTSTSSTASGAVGGSTTTVTSTPASPTVPGTAAPTGLAANEAYHVTIALSSPGTGLNTIDPVERLSVLPSEQRPLLVELGVLDGGHRVLFVVQPGTVVRGPGACTPGPVDCEIVSLAPNQTEWVGTSGSNGVTGVALMAVTALRAADYSSASAAARARGTESAAGRHLLSQSTSRALSLFRYEPGLGAVVDLSNVTVGGS